MNHPYIVYSLRNRKRQICGVYSSRKKALEARPTLEGTINGFILDDPPIDWDNGLGTYK